MADKQDSENEMDEEMDMVNMESDEEDDDMEEEGSQKVYLPSETLEEGEELVCDESAYTMYHQAHTGLTHHF